VKYLFSRDGRLALQRLAVDSNVLIALDFDGTLAPIVHRPPCAQIPPYIARELDRLCAITPVAIISGRELSDLKKRVPAGATHVIGNHGNEGLAAISVDTRTCRNICADWTRQLQRMSELHASGVHVEQKSYTLAIHFRLATDHVATQGILSEVFRSLTPVPRIVSGKCVFDLIPPGAAGKDDAMKALVKQTQPHTVLYIGDDECDELVFASAQPDWTTIRVGYLRQSAAKYYLRRQREMRDLLLLLNLNLGLKTSRRSKYKEMSRYRDEPIEAKSVT
jgi:trehalose 6-phosphate phosphatase